MKYTYELKYNGVWYKPGEEVPTSTPATSEKEVKPETVEKDNKANSRKRK